MSVFWEAFRQNAAGIGSAGIILFTFIGAATLARQNWQIWRHKSGQSVSVIWMGYFLCLQTVIFFYGLHTDRLPLIVNGLVRGLFYPTILWGLWKYKGFARRERRLLLVFILATMGFVWSPRAYQQAYFFVFNFGLVLTTFLQTRELYRAKAPGVLDIAMLWVFMLASLCWLIYGFAVHDWVLQCINPLLSAILGATIVLWYHYRRRARRGDGNH